MICPRLRYAHAVKDGVDLQRYFQFFRPACVLQGQVIRSGNLTEGIVVGGFGGIDNESDVIDSARFQRFHARSIWSRGGGGNGLHPEVDG